MSTMKTLNGYGFNATELNGKAASDYLQKTDTATNSAKLGGKAPEYYIQPRNLLDNSDFRNPVNQRGKTSYTGGGYTIDRWLLGINAVVINVLDDGIEITGGDSTYNASYIQKVPENLTGKTMTLAVCDSDGVITTVTGAVQTDSACITNAAWGSIKFYHSSSDGTLWVQINVNYGGSKIFRWAALYEGSYTADTLPPYVPKGYRAELAECQRYAYLVSPGMAFSGYITSSSKNFVFHVPCSPMRDADVKPTVASIPRMTIRTVNGYSSIAPQNSPIAPSSLTVQDYHPDSYQMNLCATFSSDIGTNNTPAVAQFRFDDSALISLDL